VLKGAADDAIANSMDARAAQEAQAASSGAIASDQTICCATECVSARGRAAEQAAAHLGTGIARRVGE